MLDDLMNKAKEMFAESEAVQNAITAAKQKATDLGISSEIFDELVVKAKELMADGKISKEEIVAEVTKLAEAKGVSPEMIDKVLGFLK